jgi:hypothetical protein
VLSTPCIDASVNVTESAHNHVQFEAFVAQFAKDRYGVSIDSYESVATADFAFNITNYYMGHADLSIIGQGHTTPIRTDRIITQWLDYWSDLAAFIESVYNPDLANGTHVAATPFILQTYLQIHSFSKLLPILPERYQVAWKQANRTSTLQDTPLPRLSTVTNRTAMDQHFHPHDGYGDGILSPKSYENLFGIPNDQREIDCGHMTHDLFQNLLVHQWVMSFFPRDNKRVATDMVRRIIAQTRLHLEYVIYHQHQQRFGFVYSFHFRLTN